MDRSLLQEGEQEENIDLLIQNQHTNPHEILGLHREEGFIRLWRPDAEEIFVELQGEIRAMEKVHEAGLFEISVPDETSYLDYRIYHQNGLLDYDPYAFSTTFSKRDAERFGRGEHADIHKVLGGRLISHQGSVGTKFLLWAPNAKQVSLVADFNYWNGRTNPMRFDPDSGVWEIFIPGIQDGEKYKFEVLCADDLRRIKIDPFAHACEVRPLNASVVADVSRYIWNDDLWMEKREKRNIEEQPLNLYEVHLGSWRVKQGGFLNYREIAHELSSYCKKMGYNGIEILPISEHPLDESWGYQVTGFYAISSRFGSVEDFQYFVDHMHRENLAVILDWVPGHFPTDDFALAQFDGTYLFEHEDPRQGYHPHWNTHIFNYGRFEVANFLLGSALFYLEDMHIDGLRVDAVASMLYLDYGRGDGEWIPNKYGGKENLEAIDFLKQLNALVHKKFPGVVMIAEESTAFPGITTPIEEGGLGFDYKWHMGWMHDSLRFFQTEHPFRHLELTHLKRILDYSYDEKFLLVLSHDEVVHGKRSLIDKMPGNEGQKFANMRMLLSFMMTFPGKKLLFMGGEIGQWLEWNCKEELHWSLLQEHYHQKLHRFVSDLNAFYLERPSLWENDHTPGKFQFLSSQEDLLICGRNELMIAHNFGEKSQALPIKGAKLILSSDDKEYGGMGLFEEGKVPPLTTLIFEDMSEEARVSRSR